MENKLDKMQVSKGVVDPSKIPHDQPGSSLPDPMLKIIPEVQTEPRNIPEQRPDGREKTVEDFPASNPPVKDAIPTTERSTEVETERKEEQVQEDSKQKAANEEVAEKVKNKGK